MLKQTRIVGQEEFASHVLDHLKNNFRGGLHLPDGFDKLVAGLKNEGFEFDNSDLEVAFRFLLSVHQKKLWVCGLSIEEASHQRGSTNKLVSFKLVPYSD